MTRSKIDRRRFIERSSIGFLGAGLAGNVLAPAGRTAALIVQRARVVLMARVLDVEHPVPREHLPGPPRA